MKNLAIFLFFFLLKTAVFAQDFDKLIEEGDVFYNKAEYEEAAKIFTKAIAADPQNSKGYWYRGDAYFHSRKYAEAVSDYTKAIEIEPTYNRFYTKRGNSFKNLGQNDKACEDFQKGFDLGDAEARTDAREILCEWAKIAETPCPQGEAAIQKIEVDPFTGAVFISKGLHYDKFEIEPKEGVGTITGARLGKDDSFVLKLLEPENFCADGDGNVLFGLGFSLYDDAGASLGEVADLYAEQDNGLPSEFLKSLSATLSFEQLEIAKNYLLKVRFFDKRGNGEVLVEMPFTLAKKSDVFNNTSTTVNTLGLGIKSAAVGAEVKSLTFKNADNSVEDHFKLKANQPYTLNLTGVKKLAANVQYSLRIVSNSGEIIHNETGKAAFKKGDFTANLPVEKLLKGNYTVWIKLFDGTKNNFGAVIPINVQ
jgi:tetratricopeptide (TPR) repeat protein